MNARGSFAPMMLMGIVSLAGCVAGADGSDDGTLATDDPAFQAEAIDSMREVEILAHDAGLPCADLAMAGAIAKAESGLDTRNRSHNGPTSGCPGGSWDRGLWQINGCYHSEVSDACAYDAACNARAMASISSHGSSWSPWSTYWNGAYKKYLSVAKAAYSSGVPGCTGGGPAPPTGGSCYSHTLGRNEPQHTCVQSKYDREWYTCIGGTWKLGKSVDGACSSVHALP